MSDERYSIKIVMRDGRQVSDDYHATVKRRSDGVELIWVSRWKWLLKLKIRRKALDKHFKIYDHRQKKLMDVEEFER